MKQYKIKGIIIKKKPFMEADKLLTIYSFERGKIRAVAKGARKPKSKFGGRLEIFSYNNFLVNSGRNLDIISDAATINSFQKIKRDFELIKKGSYFLNMVDKITPFENPNMNLFILLKNVLLALEENKNFYKLDKEFKKQILEIEGIKSEETYTEREFKVFLEDYVV